MGIESSEILVLLAGLTLIAWMYYENRRNHRAPFLWYQYGFVAVCLAAFAVRIRTVDLPIGVFFGVGDGLHGVAVL